MLSDIPTRRTPTLYSLLGDWFAWADIAPVVTLVAMGITAARRHKG